MIVPRSLSLDELLEVCLRNRLIDRYRHLGSHLVIMHEQYVHELNAEHAQLFLQNLIRYARGNVSLGLDAVARTDGWRGAPQPPLRA